MGLIASTHNTEHKARLDLRLPIGDNSRALFLLSRTNVTSFHLCIGIAPHPGPVAGSYFRNKFHPMELEEPI